MYTPPLEILFIRSTQKSQAGIYKGFDMQANNSSPRWHSKVLRNNPEVFQT